VWTSNQDANWFGVFGQRFNPDGSPAGGEFQVNTVTLGPHYLPRVGMSPTGDFVVVWSGFHDGSDFAVLGQRFDARGGRLGTEFQVNIYTTGYQFVGDVAVDGSGQFVAIWTSGGQDGDGSGVFGRRYGSDGVPIGGEFTVNAYTTGPQSSLSLAMDGAGNFAVAWVDDRLNIGSDIYVQRFDGTGAFRGSEFRVNTQTVGTQTRAVLSSDGVGNLVVAWEDRSGNGRIVGRRFGGLTPDALKVDTLGNGVLEPGESVEVAPAWLNTNSTAQTFSATLFDMAGPPPATYIITDSTGSYGTVVSGGTAACIDCYAVSVPAPVRRPALHWDAVAMERLLPDTQGQHKRWTLHLGDSFLDVGRSSSFYRFVETLLHHSITGGCESSLYCPGASTTREQMAPFVLLAKEGAGYVPPACSTPLFNDVPASSAFCRWIEELARRGVVSGCGGGDYCPAAPVTREQMAVFVLRALDTTMNPPPCSVPLFADVAANSPYCRWIEELARRGVVSGCGGGNYCPGAAVTREQMSVFISATFGLDLYGP
jgi:hypothetical protein